LPFTESSLITVKHIKIHSISRFAFASFIGTTIEFCYIYIYSLAVAVVIELVFFPKNSLV